MILKYIKHKGTTDAAFVKSITSIVPDARVVSDHPDGLTVDLGTVGEAARSSVERVVRMSGWQPKPVVLPTGRFFERDGREYPCQIENESAETLHGHIASAPKGQQVIGDLLVHFPHTTASMRCTKAPATPGMRSYLPTTV